LHQLNNCRDAQSSIIFIGPLTSVAYKNKVVITGKLNVTKNVDGPMSMNLTAQRCTLDNRNCELYPILTVNEICKKVSETDTFLKPLLENFEPRLKCPLEAVCDFK
jgi:hypothetical protein